MNIQAANTTKKKRTKLKSKKYIKLGIPNEEILKDELNIEKKETLKPKPGEIAVLLVNFGGPCGLNNIKPFLYNLFSDPVILNVNKSIRKPLAWLISTLRSFSSKAMYKKTGSISPLIPITYLQAEKLKNLFYKSDLPFDVFVSFRYCKPDIPETLNTISNNGYKKIVILPLFPQYSYTTTGSVQLEIDRWIDQRSGLRPEIFFIKNWHDDSDYIESFIRQIFRALDHCDHKSSEIIFSAHSIPTYNIENGDPYEEHIKETAQLIIKKLHWKNNWHLAYQSKIGPVKWLEPSTDKIIHKIGQINKNTTVLVVPISFICEHVETIYEVGILYKDVAKKAGIKKFIRIPALNTDKYLIQALYNQVLGCLKDNSVIM